MHKGIVHLSAAALAAAVLINSASAASPPGGQNPSGQWAPGAPYVDPARCDALPGIIERMTKGLPDQRRRVERTQQMLRDAREGKLKSEAERREVFIKAAISFANKIGETVATLRKSLNALHQLSPAEASRRLTLLQHLETMRNRASELQLAMGAGVAFANYRDVIRKQMDDWRQFAILAQETGVTDTLASWAAGAALPVVGPMLVEGATVLRDYIYAEMQVNMSEVDVREQESNLLEIGNAVRNQEFQISALEAERTSCVAERERRQAESKPAPQVEEKKGGMNDTLFYGGLGALVGGAYLYSEYGKTSAQCTPPSVNVLTVCSSQGGSSAACQSAGAAQRAYCTCLGMGYSGGNCTG